MLKSCVKGKTFERTLEDLGKCLKVPYEGESIMMNFTCDWAGYEKWKYFYSINMLFEYKLYYKREKNYGITPNRHIFYSANLSVSDGMLHYFTFYILMPKYSNHFQINYTEMQVSYAIKNKLQVNWAYVIMQHMISQRKLSGGLPYARLITKIMKSFDIDLNVESRL